jgi:hypothetical protein
LSSAPMPGNGETVCLIPDLLHQVRGRRLRPGRQTSHG